MARIFKIPFGAQGDTEQVPEAPQGDGSVSLTQGFGYDYEREYEDPAAKDIRREVMNGLFHDITEAIGDIQLSGIAKWSEYAAPYPAGAVVWHDSVAWMSTAGNNSSVPGSGQWLGIATTANATEITAGLIKISTTSEARALTNDTNALTPKKLEDAFTGANQLIDGTGFQRYPGGMFEQWITMDPNVQVEEGEFTVTLPVSYNTRIVFATVIDEASSLNPKISFAVKAFTSLSQVSFFFWGAPANAGPSQIKVLVKGY